MGRHRRNLHLRNRLRLRVGARVLANNIRDLPDKYQGHSGEHRIHIPESAEFRNHARVSEYDVEYAFVWPICIVCGVYVCRDGLGLLCVSRV